MQIPSARFNRQAVRDEFITWHWVRMIFPKRNFIVETSMDVGPLLALDIRFESIQNALIFSVMKSARGGGQIEGGVYGRHGRPALLRNRLRLGP